MTTAIPTILRPGETTTVTIEVRNTGAGSVSSTTVRDTISGTSVVVGSNGGRLTYVSGSMSVSGASHTGSIESSGGVELRDIPRNSTVTIRYQLRADTSSISVNGSSTATNVAMLSTGGQSSATVTLIGRQGGGTTYTPPPQTPQYQPQPQPYYPPPAPPAPRPPSTSRNGPLEAAGMVVGAMTLGGAGTFGLRKKLLALLRG